MCINCSLVIGLAREVIQCGHAFVDESSDEYGYCSVKIMKNGLAVGFINYQYRVAHGPVKGDIITVIRSPFSGQTSSLNISISDPELIAKIRHFIYNPIDHTTHQTRLQYYNKLTNPFDSDN